MNDLRSQVYGFPFLLLLLLSSLALGGKSVSAQAFTVTTGLSTLTIHPGDSNVPLPVTLSGSSTYSGPVTVTLTRLPSGITVTPAVLSPGGTGTLKLSASVAADQEAFPASDPANADTSTSTITVLAFAGSVQATANLTLTVSLENPSFQPDSKHIDLPIIRIDTSGAQIADKTTDIPGTLTITSADGQTTYLPGKAGSDNTATFRLRGNSTLQMPKKPYRIKLNTSSDLLTGMGLKCPYVTGAGKAVCDKSKSYILLANYDDKTMLRDWAASALANAIPIGGQYLGQASGSPSPSGTTTLMPWAPHSLFVELYVNNVYEGTYQLIEQIKIDSHRVNIAEMDETDISGKAQTGGYLLEFDLRQGEDFNFITPKNKYIGLVDPDFSPEVPEQTSYIASYVNTAENALFSGTFTDPATGWRAYFDQASAVNYYIVNDLMGNRDSGSLWASAYFYKDRNNPLLYMGPVWDFDVSSGNDSLSSVLDPTVPWVQTQSVWYGRWFQDPAFKAAAAQQWNALKTNGVLSSWLTSISTQAATLEQTQANNFGRWPMQGIRVWPNAQAVGSYDAEVSFLHDWLTLRMGYMDGFLNGTPATTTTLSVVSKTLRAGSPVTLTAKVTGANPTGTVTFSYNSIVLGQSPLDSTGMSTFTTSNIPAGVWYLQAYYNGDASNTISGAQSSQVSVAQSLAATTTNLTASIAATAYGSSVTLTGAVVANSGTTAPTGTMSFSVNGTSLGSTSVSSAGTALLTTSSLPAGIDEIQIAYSGDNTYAASTSNTLSLFIDKAIATITWPPPSSITYGTPLSNTQLNATATLPGTITYSPMAGTILPAGTQTLTATFTPTDAANVSIATKTAQITVAQQATTTGLTASATSIKPGETLSFTATVTPAASGSPSGSLSLYDGSALLLTQSLASGTAGFSTATLLSGTHSITAVYAGDANYLISQTTSPIAITVAPLDFTLAASGPTQQTISTGGSATFTYAIAPLYNAYPGPVTFTVTGLPAGLGYTLSQSTLAVSAGSQTINLTIGPAQTASTYQQRSHHAEWALALLLLPLAGLRLRRSSCRLLVALAAITIAIGGLTGCGSNQATPSHTVTLTASSGTVQHTVAVVVETH